MSNHRIFVITEPQNLDTVIKTMDDLTNAWTLSAARGECGWICSDCCGSDPKGMPDECFYGHEKCTKIIQRDKQRAQQMK